MRVTGYRICQDRYAATAMDGEGARIYGGRWNAKGTRMVYLAGSLALAQLEMLVHLDSEGVLHARYVFISVEIPEELIADLPDSELPEFWDSREDHIRTKLAGEAWARAKKSAVLRVPSAVVPMEQNYLANPAHPDFPKLVAGSPHSLRFDPRLTGRK